MKTLVLYYSRTGNNRYLANKIAERLTAEIEEIKPRLNIFPVMLALSFLKTSLGIKKLAHNVADYKNVILCAPTWMGKLVSPVRGLLDSYGKDIKMLYFANCCGSSDKVKDDKFGYTAVHSEVKAILNGKTVQCSAFPVGLLLPEDKQQDGGSIMKARLTDANFTGEIKQRFDDFIQKVAENK